MDHDEQKRANFENIFGYLENYDFFCTLCRLKKKPCIFIPFRGSLGGDSDACLIGWLRESKEATTIASLEHPQG